MLIIIVVSVVITIYDIGYIRGWNALFILGDNSFSPHGRWPYIIIALRAGFITAFIISMCGLMQYTIRGIALSLAALLLVVIGYLWWYFDSLRILRQLEIADYSQLHMQGINHVGGLHGGTWWDLILLTITILLLLWHFRVLYRLKENLI
jgi:hypothetical protein